jgi:hypothetical protein
MPLINKYNNKSGYKCNLLLIISLIILSIGILFLMIGYGDLFTINKNISLDNGLITIPKIGHIDFIKDSKQLHLQL